MQQCVLHTTLRWYDRNNWQPVWRISTPSAAVASIVVLILNPGPNCICGAGYVLFSCTWFPLHPCAWGVGVLPAVCGVADRRRVAKGGGRGRSGGATPPGRVTSSSRKSPVARALLSLSNFGHLTLYRLSNAWQKLSLNS